MRKNLIRVALLATVGAGLIAAGPAAAAPLPLQVAPSQPASSTPWAERVWRAAAAGRRAEVIALLNEPVEGADAASARLAERVEQLLANIDKREATRAEEIARVEKELAEHLAAGAPALTEALRSAVELHMLVPDKDALLAEQRMRRLVAEAETAARAAQRRGEWLEASELFFRLNLLHEQSGKFRQDMNRENRRVAMIRLYAPERLWEMRQARRKDGDPPLPPYNAMGDSFDAKLQGVNLRVVARAINQASDRHLDPLASRRENMLRHGYTNVRTLVTTADLRAAFPGLADEQAVERFLGYVDQRVRRLADPAAAIDVERELRDLIERSTTTVRVSPEAILHEFGIGALEALDEFSGVIWPDEVRRFERNTQARFVGVGIQIQMDEAFNIKVVTPLDGSPALRAGVRPGDLIRAVDGQSTAGFTLDQAVDNITGPAGTRVRLTLERRTGEGDEEQVRQVDVDLLRAEIRLATVKGWRKTGPADDQWDWFVDPVHRIAYIRLSGFSEPTADEFDRAIAQIRASGGMAGLVLDLRFNPGGLLEQAVEIASRFIDVRRAGQTPFDSTVVTTIGRYDRPGEVSRLKRRATLADIPVVVLVNEGSASASEIVSGAIQDYAARDACRAIVLGARTFGKGSVQNVWQLDPRAMVKVTTQHYALPGSRHIHRVPGSATWGIDPNLEVEMLSKQITDALILRQEADVVLLDNGPGERAQPADPERLIGEGIDLQLEFAVVLVQSQTMAQARATALAEPRLLERAARDN